MCSQALHVLCLPIKVCIVKLIWYPFAILFFDGEICTSLDMFFCLILSWFSFFERLIIIYQKEEEEGVLLLYKIDDKRGDDLTYQNLWNFSRRKIW